MSSRQPRDQDVKVVTPQTKTQQDSRLLVLLCFAFFLLAYHLYRFPHDGSKEKEGVASESVVWLPAEAAFYLVPERKKTHKDAGIYLINWKSLTQNPLLRKQLPPQAYPLFFQPIPINKADQTLLQTLPGIGATMAQKIVDFREQEGPFVRIEDLSKIRGIGGKRVGALRGLVLFD